MAKIIIILFFIVLAKNPSFAQTFERVEDSLLRIIKSPQTNDTTIAKSYLQLISKGAFYKSKDSLYAQKAETFFSAFPVNRFKLQFGFANMDAAGRRGDFVKQIIICNENIKMAEALRDTVSLAKLLSTKASTFVNYGNEKKGIALQKKVILLFNRQKIREVDRANNYFLAGWFIFNTGETDEERKKSLGYFIQAYLIIKQYPKEEELYNKMEYSGWIANGYSLNKDYVNAISYRRKSIEYIHLNGDQKFQLGDAYRYMGNVYDNMKNYDSARVYYQKSYELFLSINEPTRSCILSSVLALVQLKLNEPQNAKHTIERVLSNDNFRKNVYYSEFLLKAAAKVFDKNNDFKKSSELYAIYVRYNDSITKTNAKNKLAELDLKTELENTQLIFEFEQDKKEEIFAKEKQKQAIIRNALIGGVLLFVLLILVLYRSNKFKQRDNVLLKHQKTEIEYQKKEIQDSINYARNIQNALLPNETLIAQSFPNFFILYKPKDVISGDFYWFYKSESNNATHPLFIAAADCTGHGVPGAFMSMLGADSLDNSIKEKEIFDVGESFTAVNKKIKSTLGQTSDEASLRDGMDIVLCAFKKDFSELEYAGAQRPLYVLRNQQIFEYKATKQSIGGLTADEQVFIKHNVPLEKGDMVYLTSDGYADQFGGEKGKKFTTSRFKELLKTISLKTPHDQKQLLETTIEDWKGKVEQLDDILIIGIRI